MNPIADPPVEYLRNCSETSLRYFEMSKLEHVANLRRELGVLLDEMMEESALALLARWMIDKRAGAPSKSELSGSEKNRASRKARNLLADFITFAGLAAPPSPAGQTPAAGPDLLSSKPTASNGQSARNPADCVSQSFAAREHAPPPGGISRSYKRSSRKAARPVRPCVRSSDASR
jgi:hypothetical protein